MAEHADAPISVARAFLTKGSAWEASAGFVKRIALIRAAEAIARENDHSELIDGRLVMLGYHLGEVDNVEAPRSATGMGSRSHVESAIAAQMLQFINNIGYTGFLTGDWDAALAEMDAALGRGLRPRQPGLDLEQRR